MKIENNTTIELSEEDKIQSESELAVVAKIKEIVKPFYDRIGEKEYTITYKGTKGNNVPVLKVPSDILYKAISDIG